MTTCEKCHGELYADRRSIEDMRQRGYHGGRITCAQGCTSIWLFERIIRDPYVVVPKTYHKEPRRFQCRFCGQWDLSMGNNAKRCETCRVEHLRLKKATQESRLRRLHDHESQLA